MKRRDLFGLGFAAPALAAGAKTAQPCAPVGARKKIAAIVTEYRHYSHADVLVGRLLSGYSANNEWTPPRNHIVSLYTDQVPKNDMSRDLAARNGFKIYPTIKEALTLGGQKLAVDGVVFIGEHGNYPTNELGQKLYPRYELFSQILDVYEESGRSVPTFFDKHYSYSWEKADKLFQRSKKLGFPFMAGSSIPVTIRKPPVDPPLNAPVTEAIAVGYADPDAYGFHTLESLQCLVERRKGGETGIASVQWIEGDAIWAWRDSAQGAWSKPLLEEAVRLQPTYKPGPIEALADQPVLFVLNYRDGLNAAALTLSRRAGGFTAAYRIGKQEKLASVDFVVPSSRPLPNWDGIVRCIDLFLDTGEPAWPAERTLLTTGALSFCFESKRDGGKLIETPQLRVQYKPVTPNWFQTA